MVKKIPIPPQQIHVHQDRGPAMHNSGPPLNTSNHNATANNVFDATTASVQAGAVVSAPVLSPGSKRKPPMPPPASPPILIDSAENRAVKTKQMPWFHGHITRDTAESLLNAKENPDGTFLVRESTNFPGDFTLCVVFQKKVEHYRIIMEKGHLTIDEETEFPNLTKLIEHYEKDADGLCTHLTEALQAQHVLSDIDTEAFEKGEWVIQQSDIEFKERIGRGEFGDVCLGIYKGQKVAIKVLKDMQYTRHAHKFLAEAAVMTSLQHENLVTFLGIVMEKKSYKIVTEFMSKGSLLEFLRSRGRQQVKKKDQIKFARDTCTGMAYLESQKIIHRDLAARNVLLSGEDGNVIAKVSDFGLALHDHTYQSSTKLPIKWTAPEALKDKKFSSKSDMWSFGVLLWEIYSFGRVPYPRIPLASVVEDVRKGHRMDPPEGCPGPIYEIMKRSWLEKPEDRPDFAEVGELLRNIDEQNAEGVYESSR